MASRSTAQAAYRGSQLPDRFVAHLKPLITATERKPKEGTIPGAVYSAFLSIHFESKRVVKIALHTGQHSLARPLLYFQRKFESRLRNEQNGGRAGAVPNQGRSGECSIAQVRVDRPAAHPRYWLASFPPNE